MNSPSAKWRCTASNAGCCPSANKRGIMASPCSPPPARSCAWCPHHPPTRTLTAFHKTWTRMALRCGHREDRIMARREIRSNTLIPSMEVTVARGWSSVIPCNTCATNSHPLWWQEHTEKERWHPVPLDVPCHNASDATIWFLEGCEPAQPDYVTHLEGPVLWPTFLPPGKTFLHPSCGRAMKVLDGHP